MNFLNPWLLAGVAGIASPIIIHLLARKQVKRVVWAAMRFLKATVDRNQRRMTVEDILLLAMRCLVIALLALALARPALRSSSLAALGTGETAILLLDHSGSMSTTDGVVTRFEKARQAAEQIIDALPGGSAVAVWLVSDSIRQVIPEPTRDFALARKVIREARRGDEATAWEPAIRKAYDVLARQPGVAKQVYILTDAQASGWRGVTEVRNFMEAARQEVQVRLVLVGEGEQANLAVTGIRLASAMATAGQPLRFEVSVANFGREEVRDVAVSLGINAEPPGEEQTLPVLPPTGEPRSLSLYATFPSAGFHTVTARVHSDRCPFDDRRTLALKVIAEISVLLVDGDPGTEPRESEVFYLQNALTPVPPEFRAQYFIKTKTVSVTDFERTPLGEHAAVILANVVDLSPAAATALEDYVRAGGGLMVFPGSRISAAFYNDRLHTAAGFLPAAFGEVRGEAVDETKGERPQTFFTLQGKGYDHRIVLPWQDPKSGNLATAHFYRAFPLIPAKADSASEESGPPVVVLSFSDGMPAVVEKTFGAGRVIQFASTADTGWSDLPVRPVFVPLVHRALGHLLARQEERLNVRAGAPFTYRVSQDFVGRDFAVVEPGQAERRTPWRRLDLLQQLPLIQHEDTSLGGAYQVVFRDSADFRLQFAVQPDPGESSLRELSAADLRTLGEVAPVLNWGAGTDLKTLLRREYTGTELWLPLLFAVLGLVVAETILGNRWSRSR